MWRSLVAHLHGVQGVGGSNPLIPTNKNKGLAQASPFILPVILEHVLILFEKAGYKPYFFSSSLLRSPSVFLGSFITTSLTGVSLSLM